MASIYSPLLLWLTSSDSPPTATNRLHLRLPKNEKKKLCNVPRNPRLPSISVLVPPNVSDFHVSYSAPINGWTRITPSTWLSVSDRGSGSPVSKLSHSFSLYMGNYNRLFDFYPRLMILRVRKETRNLLQATANNRQQQQNPNRREREIGGND